MRSEYRSGATPQEIAERWRIGRSTAVCIVRGFGSYKDEVRTTAAL